MKKYILVHHIARSANGEAIINVNTLTRRITVTPLTQQGRSYRGYGCVYTQCENPGLTCNKCPFRFKANIVF